MKETKNLDHLPAIWYSARHSLSLLQELQNILYIGFLKKEKQGGLTL